MGPCGLLVQRVSKVCRKLAQKLACMDTPVLPQLSPYRSSTLPSADTPSSSVAAGTSADGRQPNEAGNSAFRTPPYEGPQEDEDDDQQGGYPYGDDFYDELGNSQLGGAPFLSQPEEQVI